MKQLKRLVALLSFAFLLTFFAASPLIAPELHQQLLIKKTERSVVVLMPPGNTSTGGTGFQVETPQGEFVLTNGHVCNLMKDGIASASFHFDQENYDNIQFLKVLKISEYSDLCLLEPMEGVPSLKLGSNKERLDNILVVGHPFLNPSTPSFGKILSEEWAEIWDPSKDLEACKGPTYKVRKIPYFFFIIDACIRTVHSYNTNAKIYPGNSGSPVVDFWGKVVGIVFAGNNTTNHGLFVPVDDIKAFLEDKEASYYDELSF